MREGDMWIAVEVLKMLIQDKKVTFSDMADSVTRRDDRGPRFASYGNVVRALITEANKES